MLGRVVGSLPPTVILDGRRENGPIISGVFAEPQRPGKAIYATAVGHRRCAGRVVTAADCAGRAADTVVIEPDAHSFRVALEAYFPTP